MRIGARTAPLVLPIVLFVLAAAPAWAQWLPDGAVVCDSLGAQSGPTLLPDGSGGVVIAWQDDRADTVTDIYVQRLNTSGVPQWQAGGVPLGGSVIGGYALLPSSMVSDGGGNYIMAWIDSRAEPSTIIHMMKFTGAGQLSPSWPAGGVALSINGFGVGVPSVVADGTGGAMAFWEDSRDLTTVDGQDIYGQRVDANGTAMWRSDGQPICVRFGQQRSPRAVTDGLGGAWVTWEDPQDRRILVQHVDINGVTQFDTTGTALCDNSITGYRYAAEITSDGAGGAVVAWYDSRNGGEDIYTRRIDNLGVPQWTANGVNLCNDAGLQRWPTICRGGATDYIVSWVDYRSASPGDIYSQKVTSTGTTSWAANGVRIGRIADAPPQSSSDGSGGAYVAWDNYGGGICYDDAVAVGYTQHVVSSSAVATGWPANGRLLSSLPGPRYSPACTNDGSGGVYVAWHDARAGDCNIYAQRIGGGGEPVAVHDPGLSRGVSLLPPQPNPARDGARFEFNLAEPGDVRLQILSASGRLVRVLAAGPYPEGRHVSAWDGLDTNGAPVAAGFYLVRLEAGPAHVARPLVLLGR